jgi:NAD(P)-dependent dehydrogenase (short-subunit alcohol dehydrogenase family)
LPSDVDKPLDGRVAVVTGGGGGIGSAAALELARQGARVVVVDPGVSVVGEPLDEPTAAATADRIKTEGFSAESSTVSVTDCDDLRSLLEDVRARHGSLDIVVNTAGIVRTARLPDTEEDDWSSVLGVHFDGYLNLLNIALPMMIEAGYGRIVGVTSGVGLARTAGDALVYGAAKRAVAALTWQLGPLLPAGVNVNALSPIAATRMVRSSLIASGANPRGLDLSAMPQPDAMAPAAAYLAGDRIYWCRGRVVFSAGSELSAISPPQLLEAVRSDAVNDTDRVLGTFMPVVLAPAEAQQRSTGGSNPRFGDVFGETAQPPTPASETSEPARNCLVFADDAASASALVRALRAWGWSAVGPGGRDPAHRAGADQWGFDEVTRSLGAAAQSAGPLDGVIVMSSPPGRQETADGVAWRRLLGAQTSTTRHVTTHGAWLRAAAKYSRDARRPVRVLHITRVEGDEFGPAAQTVAQLARSANDVAMPDPFDVFSITVESDGDADIEAVSHLAARLVGAADAPALKGAELVVGRGWLGLRRHPEPAATISFGGPAIPGFVDEALRRAFG